MTTKELEALKYPIGKFVPPVNATQEQRNIWMETIAQFPEDLRRLTQEISMEQKSWKYRPDGWTVCQVVHHCADSHANAYIRFRWALTEATPTIKAYEEQLWAELPDAKNLMIDHSLIMLEGIHGRWSELLRSLSEADFTYEYFHPQQEKKFTLAVVLANYDWHCRHHLAHIENALASQGEFN